MAPLGTTGTRTGTEVNKMMKTIASALAAATLATVSVAGAAGAEPSTSLTVYKSPSCGCCGGWVDHMKAAGFTVTTKDTDEMDTVKAMLGVPADMGSCHTATIDGYVVEGHVPADAVRRLLAEKPEAAGLAAPGMPMGSPGMDNGGASEPYSVMLFTRAGGAETFQRYGQ